ncbi:unnamed protein product [Angiostrongylus costaricensis]|uniref:Sigma non-opioid intracellular receptor 1 n=1 Tax=Angiostrongylus costaricensis TaxID=334426 RepID=A0A0R3PJY0_ANGCS|nr:unnamed protein product [Angiostrongylus costaricensis]
MGFLFSKIIRNIVIAYVLFSGVQYLLRWKSYTISPKEFRSVAAKAQGVENVASAVSRLTTDLRRAYGSAVVVESSWVALTLGGIPLKALFLHASITEFIAVIGTPYPVAGRIGTHWSNSTCTVLMGSVVRLPDVGYMPNKETFSTGGNFRHGQFESYIYNLGSETYVVCYGRGIIPVSGLWAATGALSQGEPISLARLIYVYGHEAFNQLTLGLMNTINYYKAKATGKTEL